MDFLIDLLAVCSVVIAGAAVSGLLGLPFGAAFAICLIGMLFTILWIMGPITPRD